MSKEKFLKKTMNQNENKKNFKEIRLDMSFKTKIPKNLNQYDKISMNYSIENRSPYLTNDSYQIMKILKKNQLYSNKHTKKIFRNSMYKFTNDKFYFEKKMYEQAPQSEFMLSKNNYKTIKTILKRNNYCDKFFHKKNLVNYFENFKIKRNNGFLIWQYLSLNSFINCFKNI